MPKIAIFKFITFFFFPYDLLNEPPHLHFYKNKKGYYKAGKVWLETLKFEKTGDLTQKELNIVEQLMVKYQHQFIETFNRAKAGKEIKTLKLKLK
jgi:hypothetical protein